MLITLLSAGSAHARPTFELVDQSARAGDVVHFRISGVDGWGVAYHLEIDGDDLLDGRSKTPLTGTFTMPDRGEDARSTVVVAALWWSNTNGRVTRNLQYLGPALHADPPASSPEPTAPAAVPQAAPSPQPGYSPQPAAGSPLSKAVSRKPHHGRRHKPKRHATETQGSGRSHGERHRRQHGALDRRNRRAAAKQRRSKHRARRATRFFNGYAEPGGQVQPGDRNESVAPKPAPRTVVLARRRSLDDGVDASVMVPAVMTLAALTLAGTALLRRRRLASRAGRNT